MLCSILSTVRSLTARSLRLLASKCAEDVYLVSYPKSGSTWLRFLIANYLTRNRCTFQSVGLVVPDIHDNPEYCDRLAPPRLIKSHFPIPRDYPKVVHLVRDGRDVAVSYFFHCLKFGHVPPQTTFTEFLARFNRGDLEEFGAWSAHVLGWLDHGPRATLLVRYEVMKRQTAAQLARVLSFAGFDPDAEKIAAAVEASDASRMRALERAERTSYDLLRNSDASLPLVRKATTGDWSNHFDHEQHQRFIAVHGQALRRLGYI